jgi:hypothetical protein
MRSPLKENILGVVYVLYTLGMAVAVINGAKFASLMALMLLSVAGIIGIVLFSALLAAFVVGFAVAAAERDYHD